MRTALLRNGADACSTSMMPSSRQAVNAIGPVSSFLSSWTRPLKLGSHHVAFLTLFNVQLKLPPSCLDDLHCLNL